MKVLPEDVKKAFDKCRECAIESGAHESYRAVGNAFDALLVVLEELSSDANRYRWWVAAVVNGEFSKLDDAFAHLGRIDECTKESVDRCLDAGIEKDAARCSQ